MSRFVICAHCGTVVAFEPRTARTGIRLSMHLRDHRAVSAADDLSRWAQLFEHFFFVPLPGMSRFGVRQDVKLLACTPSLDD
jgi:hypothetical protein